MLFFFFSSRRRHTRFDCDWSSDVCSSDLNPFRGRGMFSLMLLAISIIALSQFALYYWRAVLAGVAAQPVSDRGLVGAQGVGRGSGRGRGWVLGGAGSLKKKKEDRYRAVAK